MAFAVAGAVSPAWELPAVAVLGGCMVGLATRPPGRPAASPGPAAEPDELAGALAWGLAVVALVVVQTSVGFARDAGGGLAVAQSNAPPPTATPSAPARYILTGPDVTDPYMLEWHGTYYIYTSEGTSALNVPVRTGPKPGRWGPPSDALPRLPSWAEGGLTWAPDVHQVAGGWALYFSALLRGSNPQIHCIGAAYGSSPLGPFVASAHPFVCQLDHRGSIDPRVFVDGTRLVLLWKSDDNANPYVRRPGSERQHRDLLPGAQRRRPGVDRPAGQDPGTRSVLGGDDRRGARHGRGLGHVLAVLLGQLVLLGLLRDRGGRLRDTLRPVFGRRARSPSSVRTAKGWDRGRNPSSRRAPTSTWSTTRSGPTIPAR